MKPNSSLISIIVGCGLLLSCAKKQILKPVEEIKPQAVETKALPEPEQVTDEGDARNTRFEKSDQMRTVYFDLDKAEIKENEKKIIDNNIEYLKANPSVTVQLAGHCDERGTTIYNLSLGQKRATSVRAYMIYMGVQGRRIYTISYGKEMPACYEHSEECWAKNRRVEFFESKK